MGLVIHLLVDSYHKLLLEDKLIKQLGLEYTAPERSCNRSAANFQKKRNFPILKNHLKFEILQIKLKFNNHLVEASTTLLIFVTQIFASSTLLALSMKCFPLFLHIMSNLPSPLFTAVTKGVMRMSDLYSFVSGIEK